MCSFCDRAGSADNRLAGGLGAMICMDRLERYCAERRDPGAVARRTEPVWEEVSVAELVATLPLILPSAAQNAAFADEWVGLLRERGVSWTEIDKALGVSRQAA